MANSVLYDDDILLWSEQQAEIVRKLGRTRRDLPNEFDVENVAEEIESVGRSELASVETQIHNILVHLIKLAAEPDAAATRHWRGEILAFHADMMRRYAPSMRQRIDFARIWQQASEQGVLLVPESEGRLVVPASPPFGLDDVLAQRIDSHELAEKLRRTTAHDESGR